MRVLIIKLGALGDFIQAFAAFAEIRSAHADAHITLLTTPPFADLAQASGLFDRVETDGRPRRWRDHLRLFRRLRAARYDRVYDLQTSSRSKNYFYGFLPFPPQWSGISWGCSHRQTRADRNAMHNLDRIADQLHVAGIGPACERGQGPAPDLRWSGRISGSDPARLARRLGLTSPFALLVPGASPAKPAKLWPTESYADLACLLSHAGLQVAVVGGPSEAGLYDTIAAALPGAIDLTGKTTLVELAALGSIAALSVGNDTGPTHLLAYAGSPGLMLMSQVTDPDHCGPRGRMTWLRNDDLARLDVTTVYQACEVALGPPWLRPLQGASFGIAPAAANDAIAAEAALSV
jgi:ADP-heptose:LPS heptosyltransferase